MPSPGGAPGYLHQLFSACTALTQTRLGSLSQLRARDTSSEQPALTTLSKAVLPAPLLPRGLVISGAATAPWKELLCSTAHRLLC